MRFSTLASPIVALGLAATTGAWAQSSPGSCSIANSLKLTARLLDCAGEGGLGPRVGPPTQPAVQPAVRPSVNAAKVTPPPSAHDDAQPTAEIYPQFASGSAALTPDAMTKLDEVGKALKADEAGYRFRIEGRTDTVGSKQSNQVLSERRAIAAANYIARKFRIDSARLVPVGVGSDKLVVQTPDQTANAYNRCIVIVNLGV